MPRNNLPNRFYIKKKNNEEIRRLFSKKISHVKEAEAPLSTKFPPVLSVV
jgi:hypothetical protein